MTTLSYSLGADDISKIVDAILPKLSPFLPNSTKDEQYVLLHKSVLHLSKGNTFSNKEELNTLVKSIVTSVSDKITKKIVTGSDSKVCCRPSIPCSQCTYCGSTTCCSLQPPSECVILIR